MPVRLLTRKVAMGLSFLWKAVFCSQAATAASFEPPGSRSAYLACIQHLIRALILRSQQSQGKTFMMSSLNLACRQSFASGPHLVLKQVSMSKLDLVMCIHRPAHELKVVSAIDLPRGNCTLQHALRQRWDGNDLCPHKHNRIAADQVSNSWQEAARGVHQIHQQHSNRPFLPHLQQV